MAHERDARSTLIQLHEYLLVIREQVLLKSDAGQAIAYALKNRMALTRYCIEGELSVDNNAIERSLTGFAIGRNSWTLFGSDNGGNTAAVLHSFVTSCELVKIDPLAWLKEVLARITDHPVKRLEELLPHRWAETVRCSRSNPSQFPGGKRLSARGVHRTDTFIPKSAALLLGSFPNYHWLSLWGSRHLLTYFAYATREGIPAKGFCMACATAPTGLSLIRGLARRSGARNFWSQSRHRYSRKPVRKMSSRSKPVL